VPCRREHVEFDHSRRQGRSEIALRDGDDPVDAFLVVVADGGALRSPAAAAATRSATRHERHETVPAIKVCLKRIMFVPCYDEARRNDREANGAQSHPFIPRANGLSSTTRATDSGPDEPRWRYSMLTWGEHHV
jgi:hypothetical protein